MSLSCSLIAPTTYFAVVLRGVSEPAVTRSAFRLLTAVVRSVPSPEDRDKLPTSVCS